MKKFISQVLSWIISIAVPLVLILTAVRLLITPIFPMTEYQFPWFPEDEFGFTTQERLNWAKPSINYLVNSEGISYLEKLEFEDGTPIFNERELSHMADVKALVSVALTVWYVSLGLVLIGSLVLVAILKFPVELKKALSRGGWLSGAFVVGLLLLILVNFNELFNQFHYLFFKGDTWLFYTSDTLIRLFPLRFWSDAFIFVGIFTLVGGLSLAFGVKTRK